MKSLHYFLPLIFFLIAVSCANEKINYNDNSLMKTNVDSTYYEGQITVVGNEPFSKLALIIADTTIYTLDCNEETRDSLLKNQVNFIEFSQRKKKTITKTGIKLKIDKTELIRK
ncbi:MAG: hypothetical protein H6613_06280 [Ignavibacteriales bacterium]|nr:hypothetical protein [Ignavibacteriales bacterium]